MPMEVRVKAPDELKDLVKRLKGVDTTMAKGKALSVFSPELNRNLIENSGQSGAFARGWMVNPLPGGAGIVVRNVFGKALYVEEPTKPHVILPKRRGGMAVFRHKLQQAFAPKKVPVGLVKNKFKKAKEKRQKTEGAKRKNIVGVLAWRKGGKRAFSAYKVNASTKAGAFIYAKEVHHPGTKGKFVFKRTIRETSERLFSLLVTELKQLIQG